MLTRFRQFRLPTINRSALAGFLAGAALCLALAGVAGTVFGGGLSDTNAPGTPVYPNL